MVVQCCMCKKVRNRGKWIRLAGLSLAYASHTYCPDCYRDSVEQFRREREATMLLYGLGPASSLA